MDESEADTSTGSETERSDGDMISDDSASEPASPRGEDAVSSRRAGAAEEGAPADGELGHDPGGSAESLRLGPLVGVHEDSDMVDAESDDVAEFLPEPQRPPGIRPPYRGLSITIPPDEDEDPGFTGCLAVVGSPGLSIKIWKVTTVRSNSARAVACLELSQHHLREPGIWAVCIICHVSKTQYTLQLTSFATVVCTGVLRFSSVSRSSGAPLAQQHTCFALQRNARAHGWG